jgi:hypothetical protein
MPRRGGRHQVLVHGAEPAMEAFKMEIASDLGLDHLIHKDGNFKNLTTLQVGQIGGEMVRRITAAGQYQIMQRHKAGEERLMPEEVMPPKDEVRQVSNNGNTTPHASGTVDDAPNSGQMFS